jgi:hypothetical protein
LLLCGGMTAMIANALPLGWQGTTLATAARRA